MMEKIFDLFPVWWSIPLNGGFMQRVNLYNFYKFGMLLHPIANLQPGRPFKEYKWGLYLARMWLESFVNGSLIPMTICTPVAKKAIDNINSLLPQGSPDQPVFNDEEIVGFEFLYPLTESVKEFETVFGAELQNSATYFVSKKGIYETNDLIEKADEMFPDSIRYRFPSKVKLDLCEAGKCLAFELSTAAGFHITRAVEGMLFEYLNILCPDDISIMKESQRNLGQYIKLARDKGGDEKVCSSLDQFRDLHRNPLIHPEAILTIEEAQTLLGIGQSAIVSIVIEMDKRNGPGLPLEMNAVSASGMATKLQE